MDNAISPVPPQALVPADNGVLGRLAALPARSKLMLTGGVAALVAVALSFALIGNSGDYKVLYANLSDKDGGAIVQQLSQMNVPYKYTEGGTAILVPSSQVHDVRLKLASAGLPKGGTVGFELMDNARFGQTQFQERLTFQRGLEGELVRSITSLAAVAAARVHLALPNQNGFFREQQKPSASVVLTLHPGRTLDRAQVAGIVHLVSSSVPEMAPKAVSVLDQTGALLSSPEGQAANGLDAQQLQYVAQIEGGYGKRINEILEPVVGRDNHRATTDAKGRTTSTPLSAPEIEQLTALVQQAIGFTKERGDSVRVINAPFRVEAAPKPEDVPLWQRPALQDLLRSFAMPFALALIGLAVVFGMIRPALKAALPPAPTRGTQLDAVVDDALPLPAPALEAPRSNVRLDQARVLAKDNPAAVANIVRGWVSGQAGQ